MSENTKEATAAAENATSSAPQLNINDLAVLAGAIDAASRRGAYAAAEFKTIGEAYDKLSQFLKAVEAQAAADPAATEAQTEATGE